MAKTGSLEYTKRPHVTDDTKASDHPSSSTDVEYSWVRQSRNTTLSKVGTHSRQMMIPRCKQRSPSPAPVKDDIRAPPSPSSDVHDVELPWSENSMSGVSTVSTQATSISPLFGPRSQNTSANESPLSHICLNLCERLKRIPSIGIALEEEIGGRHDADPITVLRRVLRKGYPLLDLYNALEPMEPLQNHWSELTDKRDLDVKATFDFLQACRQTLTLPECFTLKDLYGDVTTGLTKVIKDAALSAVYISCNSEMLTKTVIGCRSPESTT